MLSNKLPDGAAPCLSCGGNRWKYMIHRSDLVEDVIANDRPRASVRRQCPECAGTGVRPS